MIKGAMFTLGILAALGGFGFAVLTIFAAGMSDNIEQSRDAMSDAAFPAIVGCVGVAMIVGAFFISK